MVICMHKNAHIICHASVEDFCRKTERHNPSFGIVLKLKQELILSSQSTILTLFFYTFCYLYDLVQGLSVRPITVSFS